MEIVWQSEIDAYASAVLRKHWPGVPNLGDIRNIRNPPAVDVLCGGFPCQDISSAGRKFGITGARSGLWREYARVIGEVRPRYVIVENSSEMLSRGLSTVLGDLAALGFDAEWHCIPASAVGAPHERDRVWIVADSSPSGEPAVAINDEACGMPANGNAVYAERGVVALGFHMGGAGRESQPLPWDGVWKAEDSPVGMGVDDGVPARLDRLRALGNAIVPQIAEILGRAIVSAA